MTQKSHAPHQAILVAALLTGSTEPALPTATLAWGDEGHRMVARIAEPLLTPAARAAIDALLVADPDTGVAGLCGPGHLGGHVAIYCGQTSKIRYNATKNWHFVDLELGDAVFRSACNSVPGLPRRDFRLVLLSTATDCCQSEEMH